MRIAFWSLLIVSQVWTACLIVTDALGEPSLVALTFCVLFAVLSAVVFALGWGG